MYTTGLYEHCKTSLILYISNRYRIFFLLLLGLSTFQTTPASRLYVSNKQEDLDKVMEAVCGEEKGSGNLQSALSKACSKDA